MSQQAIRLNFSALKIDPDASISDLVETENFDFGNYVVTEGLTDVLDLIRLYLLFISMQILYVVFSVKAFVNSISFYAFMDFCRSFYYI